MRGADIDAERHPGPGLKANWVGGARRWTPPRRRADDEDARSSASIRCATAERPSPVMAASSLRVRGMPSRSTWSRSPAPSPRRAPSPRPASEPQLPRPRDQASAPMGRTYALQTAEDRPRCDACRTSLRAVRAASSAPASWARSTAGRCGPAGAWWPAWSAPAPSVARPPRRPRRRGLRRPRRPARRSVDHGRARLHPERPPHAASPGRHRQREARRVREAPRHHPRRRRRAVEARPTRPASWPRCRSSTASTRWSARPGPASAPAPSAG